MKKAITVVMMAILAFLEKRVKFGVAVPPLTKEPITRPTASNSVSPPAFFANTALSPPPSLAAVTMEYMPSTAISGTEM